MKAAFIGVGKMGFPVSLAHCLRGGHEIFAYDPSERLRHSILSGTVWFYEPLIKERTREALDSGRYHVCSEIEDATKNADIIIVAVPTPSLPDNSFDNSFVVEAVKEIGRSLSNSNKFVPIVIISTVLPGTTRRYLLPALEEYSRKKVGSEIGLDYSASFIAMGTTFDDAINPEFVLIGASDSKTAQIVKDYYGAFVPPNTPMLSMTYEEAELTKNVYNVHIGFKIVIANAVMEIAHKLGNADCDTVTNALSKANQRVVGPRYLRGGMGDGGSCHGRDSLALSSIASKLALSADPFNYIMEARSAQADWLAKELVKWNLPVVIMGERYKPNTNLLDYSAAKLVAGFVQYYNHPVMFYDPVLGKTPEIRGPHTFLIALPEPFAKEFSYPNGSVVIDVWRCMEGAKLWKNGIRYIPVGVS